MKSVTLHMFAVLKEHFEPTIKLGTTSGTVGELRQELCRINPAAGKVLQACRFAVNENFVTDQFILNDHEQLAVIPPSSGG